jgi:hypothetical protein
MLMSGKPSKVDRKNREQARARFVPSEKAPVKPGIKALLAGGNARKAAMVYRLASAKRQWVPAKKGAAKRPLSGFI